MNTNYHVVWCKQCDAVGVMEMSKLSDTGVDWANHHYKETTHTKIASLPFSMLHNLHEIALAAITRREEESIT